MASQQHAALSKSCLVSGESQRRGVVGDRVVELGTEGGCDYRGRVPVATAGAHELMRGCSADRASGGHRGGSVSPARRRDLVV